MSLLRTIARGLARCWPRAPGWEVLSGRGPEIVVGTDENALAGIGFTGPVTVIGSPASGSGFMLAIKGGTAPRRATIRPGLAFGEENGSRGRLSRVPGDPG